jgi:hypothetical protein
MALTKRIERWDDGTSTAFYSDEAGREHRVEDFDATGTLVLSIDRQYNESGANIGWTVFDHKTERTLRRFEVVFTPEGRPVELREYDEREAFVQTHELDEDGVPDTDDA